MLPRRLSGTGDVAATAANRAWTVVAERAQSDDIA
jgi:hypothetical protein